MEFQDILKKHADAVELKLGDLDEKTREALDRLFELEQKAARANSYSGRGGHEQSWGEQFVESDGLKSFADHRSGPSRFRMDVKATLTSVSDSGGSLIVPQRDPSANMLPGRRPTVRSLLTVLNTSSGSVEHVDQTARTNNATSVAEGNTKPESAYAFELVNTPVRTIAHWVPASVQVLEDSPQLRSIIDVELRYGLALEEENQLLNGDSTGANLSGLIPGATAFADPLSLSSPNMMETVGSGILQVMLNEREPNGIVMHPSDWMRMRLLKDADGKFILGDPQSAVEPRLFGLPVVPTTAMTVDKFLIGDFRAAATLWDRHEPRIEVSTEHADFFTRNLVAIRAEERLALALKNADALVYGDFGNVA